MGIPEDLSEKLEKVRQASWEQLDSVGRFEGEQMRAYILALIHMRQIVTCYASLWASAIDAGFEIEGEEIRKAMLVGQLTNLSEIVAEALGLTKEQVESAYEWANTLMEGAEQRIDSVLNEEK